MAEISFKERVRNIVINEAKKYKNNLVNYEYLVCSDSFTLKDYYIIDAKDDNYQHLTGVNSLVSPQVFFDKCYDGTLQQTDFNFFKRGENEKSVIGTVRRKINVLPDMVNIFNNKNIIAEEKFVKNNVRCSFATADSKCTLGFSNSVNSYPKSLLKGNELDSTKAKLVKLLLRKETGKGKFEEIIIGETKDLVDYYDKIKDLIDISYISGENNITLEDVAYTKEKTQLDNMNSF